MISTEFSVEATFIVMVFNFAVCLLINLNNFRNSAEPNRTTIEPLQKLMFHLKQKNFFSNSGIFGQGWGNETFDWAMWPVNRAQCPQKGPHGPVGTSWAQVGPQVER